MNNILSLVKLSLIMSFRGQIGKKRKIKKWLLGLALLVWLGPMVFAFSEIIRVMYDVFESFGQGDAIIVIGLLITSMVVFIFGVFYTIGSYYMAKDIPTYLYMPLKPWEITSARFLIVLLYEYITMLIFYLPMVIGFGIAASMGIVYYLFAALILVLLPILPLALASVIIMGIMSFAKKAMNKDRFTMIASILGLGIGIGFNIGFQGLARSADNSEGLQELIVSGRLSIAENIARYFPGLPNASKALTDGNILHLLIFIAICAISFAVFLVVARAIYFRGVIGINQSVSRREFDAQKSNGFKASSPIKTYLAKELKLIFRTPIFFMNLALIDILMPVMIIVSMAVAVGSSEFATIKSLVGGNNVPGGIFVAGAFILFVFISAMNGITSTSISREGKQFPIMQFIPMHYRDQMNAKLLSGMIISMVAMLITLVFLVVFFEISLGISFLMFLSATNAVILTRISGMFIDASNPKLNWDNEQKAVKQNMNLVFNMLIGLGAAGVAVVILIFLTQSMLWNSIIFIAGLAVLNFGLYKLLEYKFPVMLARVE